MTRMLLVGMLVLGAVPTLKSAELEEIVVTFEIRRLIQQDIFVMYDGATIYLPVIELFHLLDLNIKADLPARRIAGYVINARDRFTIDLSRNTIESYMGRQQLSGDEYLLTDYELFLRIDLFQPVFDLAVEFDFSALKVSLPLNEDFPSYRRLKRRLSHRKLQKEETAARNIKTLPHSRDYLKAGTIDWLIAASPAGGGVNHFAANIGGMVMGGDLSMSVGGNTQSGLMAEQFDYRWHYFFTDASYLTQANVGNVFIGGPLGRSLHGAMVTNKPQAQRKYFRTIHYEDHVGDGWEVELYIDGKLVDYIYTDQSGEYRFDVDIYYGTSSVELKMYGPGGETRTETKDMRIPYNLIPRGEYEYSLAVGESRSAGQPTTYTQTTGYYGLGSQITVGASIETPLSANTEESVSGAVEATIQPATNMTAAGSFAPGYQAYGSLSYSRPSLVSISGSYSKYFENAFRNPQRLVSSANAAVTIPIKMNGRHYGIRGQISYDEFPLSKIANVNYGVTGTLDRIHFNLLGKYNTTIYDSRSISRTETQLLLSPSYLRWVRPQLRATYDHDKSSLSRAGIYLSRRLFKTGQISLSVDHNFALSTNSILVNVNLFSAFADFTTRVASTGKSVSITQTQKGSIQYDQGGASFKFDRRPSVGFGSAVVKPFMDDNYNGKHEPGEEYLPGIKARVLGARQSIYGDNRLYYYGRLRPYEEYSITIDQHTMDDPSLRPMHENFRVILNPNVVTSIDIPVVTAGEASGIVKRESTQGITGAGAVKIIFMNLDRETFSQVTTFSNGEFYYLGLIPGRYRAYVDPAQLARGGYVCQPEFIEFNLKPDGDIPYFDDIEFLLVPSSNSSDTVTIPTGD